MTIIVDLDGVLCTEERTFERALARPIEGARESITALRNQGHTVVIYSARSWSEQRLTQDWLERHGFQYDGLILGKPVYDLWIDDRAVRFTDWASLSRDLRAFSQAPAHGASGAAYPADEPFLKENRRAICEFLHWLAAQDLPEPILEVGPMADGRHDSASVFFRFPEYYVDTRSLFSSKGKRYISLDMDGSLKPDIVGDVADIDRLVDAGSVGTLIMLSVLEHVPRLWEVPAKAGTILKTGGWLCLQTPWNLRFHGPRPDCWRISDDGYHALFDSGFDFRLFDRVESEGRALMPTCFKAVLVKK